MHGHEKRHPLFEGFVGSVEVSHNVIYVPHPHHNIDSVSIDKYKDQHHIVSCMNVLVVDNIRAEAHNVSKTVIPLFEICCDVSYPDVLPPNKETP